MQQPQQQYAGPFYSVDVECVATGTTHLDRAVGQIGVVDQYEQVLLNVYVRPDKPVVSYLAALTGLNAELIQQQGMPLEQAVELVRQTLPKDAVLVGQNILQDIQWLGLKEGVDFASCIDLAGLYRVWNPQYNTWSVYGQDHLAKVVLGWDLDNTRHDAVFDAVKSMRLFNTYHQMQANPQQWQQAQQALLSAPPLASFAKRNPTYEGVCMGNRKTCQCGAPFFS